MISSLYTSISGLSAFTQELSVVSNNIANSETTSYKSNSISFADVLNQSLTGVSGSSLGCGVTVSSINEEWTQGSVSSTENVTDFAISGSGLFVLEDPETGQLFYTRDGSFDFDDEGNLVYGDLAVLGYPIGGDGNLGSMSTIGISGALSPPQATSEMSTTVNLDSGADENDTFTTTTTVYDTLGNEITLTVNYTKTANANEWSWTASIPSGSGTLTGDSSGLLTFDENGLLGTGTNPSFTLELTNGAADQTIAWNLYDDAGDSNGLLTQYAGSSALSDQSQDGYAAGEVTDITVDDDGVFTATYSNGEISALYQLVLANFNNYEGLDKVDGNIYQATRQSGDVVYGAPGVGGNGTVATKSLETSNVDLATEMAELITAQSAYQACSRVFSVTSEILQTIVNLK